MLKFKYLPINTVKTSFLMTQNILAVFFSCLFLQACTSEGRSWTTFECVSKGLLRCTFATASSSVNSMHRYFILIEIKYSKIDIVLDLGQFVASLCRETSSSPTLDASKCKFECKKIDLGAQSPRSMQTSRNLRLKVINMLCVCVVTPISFAHRTSKHQIRTISRQTHNCKYIERTHLHPFHRSTIE